MVFKLNGNNSIATDFLDSILGKNAIAIGDLILAEVLQGFRHDKDYKTAKRLLDQLTIFGLRGIKMAVKSTDNFCKLRKKGVPVRKTADIIIVSYYIEHNHPFLFSDKDFKLFV